MFDDEEIPNNSPIDLTPARRVLEQDEKDESTLKNVYTLFAEVQAKADSVQTLDPKHPKLSYDQQVEARKFAMEEFILPVMLEVHDVVGELELKRRGLI